MDALMLSAMLLTAADYRQTQVGVIEQHAYYEQNPLMGHHPSMGTLNTRLAVSMAGMVATHYLLPPRVARAVFLTDIAVEAAVVAHNEYIGMRIRF